MKSSSTSPNSPKITTTSKDSIKGDIQSSDNNDDDDDGTSALLAAFSLFMIASISMSMVVVNYLMSLVMSLVYNNTSMTVSTRMFLATGARIVNLLFDLTVIRWLLKYYLDYEQLNIILVIVGSLFGTQLWFILYLHDLNPLLNLFGQQMNSSEQLGFTLWSVLYSVANLISIVQLLQDKKKSTIQENGVSQEDFFAYTLMVV